MDYGCILSLLVAIFGILALSAWLLWSLGVL